MKVSIFFLFQKSAFAAQPTRNEQGAIPALTLKRDGEEDYGEATKLRTTKIFLNNPDTELHCSYTLNAKRKGKDMIANSVVRARIDEQTKAEASIVLASIGLTVSDAVRLMLRRVVAEKALPFDPLIPNAETIEAIMEARRGDLIKIGSVADLFRDLNADD